MTDRDPYRNLPVALRSMLAFRELADAQGRVLAFSVCDCHADGCLDHLTVVVSGDLLGCVPACPRCRRTAA